MIETTHHTLEFPIFSSHFCINKDKLLLYPPDFIHFNDSHKVAKTLFFSLTNGQIYTVTLLELQQKFEQLSHKLSTISIKYLALNKNSIFPKYF